jgi:hypothetical protein
MAITANQKILTLDYWKPADKIIEGDYVFDRKGQLVKVTSTQHFYSEKCYTVHLDDLMSISCNGSAHFLLETPKYRIRSLEYKGKKEFKRPLLDLLLSELIEKPLRYKGNKLFFSIPTCEPLQFPHQDLPVPPFIFGFWYKNKIKHNHFSVKDENCDFVLQKFKDYGYKIIKKRKDAQRGLYFSVSPTIESQLAPFIPNEIPNNYLLASHEQRIELLSGIVNAKIKQYKPSIDRFNISSGSWQEIRRIQALVESIGCKTTLHHSEYVNIYKLGFKSRYRLCENQNSPPIRIHQTRRYIIEIEQIAPQQCVHIETDGPDGSFLVGEGFITCR